MVRRAVGTCAKGGKPLNTGIVVFVRYDSTRLPGKVLRPIAGRPLLGHVLDRLCGLPDRLIVATSDRPVDDPVANFAMDQAVEVFRGPAEDVLGRALACAETCGLSRVVRISGDSPFIASPVVAQVIALHDSEKPDLASNVFPRGFPFGISVEVVTVDALRRLDALTDDPEDREHVTRYLYAHRDEFRIANLAPPDTGFHGVRLVVDTDEDLARAEWIARRARPSPRDASLDQIVALARRWPGGGAEAAPNQQHGHERMVAEK